MNRFDGWRVAACLLIAVPLSAQRSPVWIASPPPITTIGSLDDSPDQELAAVSGARRLADGRVIIANGKPLELRVYDAHGAMLRRIGRQGAGPGEFGGRLDLLPAGGDSILVYDQGNQRVTLFRPDGTLAHEWPVVDGGSPRGGLILYRRSFAQAPLPAGTGCLKHLLAALPAVPPPALREVITDNAGHYFARIDASDIWSIYNTSGVAIGSIRMPPPFDLYQVNTGWVLGRALLEDDVEQVQVLRVTAPAAARAGHACTAPVETIPAVVSPRTDEFRKALRDAITAGEMAYSNYAHYVSTFDSLPGLREKLPANAVFRVLDASSQGWSAALFDRKSTLVCVFGLANAALAGWSDGGIRCSE